MNKDVAILDPKPALTFKFLVILETLWTKSKDQRGSIWNFWLLAHHYISWGTLQYSPKTSEPNVESAKLPVDWENRMKKWEINFAQSEWSKQLGPHSPTCHLAKIWMNYFLALGPKLFKKSTVEIFNDLPDRVSKYTYFHKNS